MSEDKLSLGLFQARRLLQILEYRKRYEQLRYFIPHGGQQAFIDQIQADGSFIVVSGAGNGWGKSELIVAIIGSIIWPDIAPPCFSSSFFKDWKHPKRARIYSKPAELEEIGSLQTAIKKLFPNGRYWPFKGKYTYTSTIVSDTQWVLDLFSYERDPSEAAGSNIGLQAFNEPPPQELWNEAVARARAGGIIVGGMTSLLDNPWVVDGIFNKANGADIRVRYGDVEENCKQHGKNGYLEHADIEKVLAQFDPDEREARKTGRPLSLSGAIFKGFLRDVHVYDSDEPIPTEVVAHFMAVDPALGKPLAVLWAYVDTTGWLTIYDEWPGYQFEGAKDTNLTVKDYADIFKEHEAGRNIETRILDRHFGNQRQTLGGFTLKQEFGEAGLYFIDSYKVAQALPEVETGILKVKDYLRYDRTKPLSALNRPKLRIHSKCRNTIAAMERWGRDPKTGRPKDEYKDFADCVRYLCMANPSVEEKKAESYKLDRAYYGVGNIK